MKTLLKVAKPNSHGHKTAKTLHFPDMSWDANPSDEEVSRAFISLAEFMKEENVLNKKSKEAAISFLEGLEPSKQRQYYAERVLLRLVPSPKNDTKPFATHALFILGSPTATDLVKPLMKLIGWIVWSSESPLRIQFAKSGFFTRLPSYIQDNVDQLSSISGCLRLMVIEFSEVILQRADGIQINDDHLSQNKIIEIFLENVFKPLRPFFVFFCGTYSTIEDSEDEYDFMSLMNSVIHMMTLSDNLSQYFLSLPICFAGTAWVSQIAEDEDCLTKYLMNIRDNITAIRPKDRRTLIRTKRVLRELTDEGFDDVVSDRLHWVPDVYWPRNNRAFSKGITRNLGGNLFVPDEAMSPQDRFVEQFLSFYSLR
ncbi:hypothetical protein BLNAU_11700 [Blattamonas nauphoetae]|uniref:Uncharacterized protein n=1 Tax=Blattamonas nauphoetae TaxID=2049346 RepID=A0ABQ9XPF2_9EUKA|nr:hypothetical protein BLNAU_11700 [Blattamonas nauphoetae]